MPSLFLSPYLGAEVAVHEMVGRATGIDVSSVWGWVDVDEGPLASDERLGHRRGGCDTHSSVALADRVYVAGARGASGGIILAPACEAARHRVCAWGPHTSWVATPQLDVHKTARRSALGA